MSKSKMKQKELETFTLGLAKSKSSSTSMHKPSSVSFSLKNGKKDLESCPDHRDDDLVRKFQKKQRNKTLFELMYIRDNCVSLLAAEEKNQDYLSSLLQQEEELRLRRKELTYLKWRLNVYEPIRHRILDIRNQCSAEQCNRRKELYRQYLEYVNRRGFIFMDDLDKGEAYSQAMNGPGRPYEYTARLPPLQDPLLLPGRERATEDETVLRCVTGQIHSDSHPPGQSVKLPALAAAPPNIGGDTVTWIDLSPAINRPNFPSLENRTLFKASCRSPSRSILRQGSP